MHFNFVASDYFDLNFLKSIEGFVDHFPDFQTVWLKDENELRILLELMNIPKFDSLEIKNTEFTKYWDLSNFKFPELDNQQYENFYKLWVERSNRDNNMNEYGNLIFLQGLSPKWNKLRYRLIIKEGS